MAPVLVMIRRPLGRFCYTPDMDEVITILEAKVDKDKWQLLKETYAKETEKIPEIIKQTFLIQSQHHPHNWRIMTHWRSHSDLEQMRATVKVPVGVRIFQSV